MAEDPDGNAELRAAVKALSERVARLEQRAIFASPELPPKPRPSSSLGVAAINRIGAVTLAIGIIFFFKYAVDEHLIGPGLGVCLGLLFGLLLVGAGDWLQRRDQLVFAQGIAGCGLASLYISLYASFAFYKLISRPSGFAGLTLVSVLAFALSLRYASPIMASLGVLAALLAPLLLHTAGSEAWLEVAYLCLLNVTAAALTVRRSWAFLPAIAGPLSLACGWILLSRSHRMIFCAFGGALSLLYFVATAWARATVRTTLYIVGHVALLLCGLGAVGLVSPNGNVTSESDSVLLLLYGIAVLTYGIARRSGADRILGLALTGLVVAKLYVWDVWQLDRLYRISAFIGLGGLLLLASWIYSRRRSEAQ